MIDPMTFHLPERVVAAAKALDAELQKRRASPDAVDRLLQGLDSLPPHAVVRAEFELPWLLGLWDGRLYGERVWWGATSRQRSIDRAWKRMPQLGWLLLFHRDGHFRERALRTLTGPVPSAFFFAAIAVRLNDWAEPVRGAAAAAATRLFPGTDPALVAAAAPFLLKQRYAWQRWTPRETAPLDAALCRPEVAERLVRWLCDADKGAVGRSVQTLLRGAGHDHQLVRLSREARLPAVRIVALRALIEGEVRWRSHREKQWIDKSMGRYRLAWVYARRSIAADISREAAVELAARDPSAAVRRLAVVALLTSGRQLANFDPIATRLAADRNGALRARAAYALQMT